MALDRVVELAGGPDIDVIVQSDMHMRMNTGVLLVRNSDWSRQWLAKVGCGGSCSRRAHGVIATFFGQVYEQEAFIEHAFWENAAMVALHQYDAEVRQHTRLLPYGTVQSYPPHYRAGDWLLQFPGGHDKEEKMGLWLALLGGHMVEHVVEQPEAGVEAAPQGLTFELPHSIPSPPPVSSVAVVVPTVRADSPSLAAALASVRQVLDDAKASVSVAMWGGGDGMAPDVVASFWFAGPHPGRPSCCSL